MSIKYRSIPNPSYSDPLWNSWSFETVRYFGSRHLEVKETGIVILRPRTLAGDSSGTDSDDSE